MAPAWRNSYLRYKTYFLNISSQYGKREDVRMFLELLLSLATVSIFAIFALRPTLITIAELIKDIEAKKATVVKLDEKIKSLAEAQIIYDEQKDKIALLETAVPIQPNPDFFVRQLEGILGQNSLRILTLNVDKATLLGTPKELQTPPADISASFPENASGLNFTISGSSPYTSLASFILSLENLRRPVKIDGLAINSSLTQAGKELILVLSGRTPYLRENNLAVSP